MPISQPRIIAHRRAHLVLWILGYCAVLPSIVVASDLGCMDNLAPLSGLFSSPPVRQANPDGVSVCVGIANHAARGEAGDERFVFDGETVRLSLLGRYTYGRWQFGARLPVIRHSGGALDSLIENWHETFGLPNGIRDELVDDQLAFTLQHGAITTLDLDQSRAGIGDISLHASRSLRESESASLAVEVFARLPSGSASKLTGTGATAIGLTLLARTDQVAHINKLGAEGFIQIAHSDAAKFSGVDQRRTQWQVMGQLNYSLSEHWSLTGGIGLGSAPLRSQLRPFADVAVVLEASLTRRFLGYELSAGFAEDLRVSTHPDITFRLQFRQR